MVHSHQFRDALVLLSLALPWLSAADGPGVCDDATFGSDILRFELSPNPWTSNPSLSSQRGTYLWIGVHAYILPNILELHWVPENALTTTAVKNAEVKYGTAYTNLVLPQNYYYSSNVQDGIFGSISHYDSFGSNATAGSGAMIGFVDTSEQQVLGLGLNSTFIKYFYESGRTASRSIGLYYGVPAAAGPDLERNGTMILGGYSTSRVQGELLKETYPVGAFKLARQCPWEVDVSSISISGQELGKSSFKACVEPQEAALVLSQSIYQSLKASESSDLTITLSNGLTVTIPSSLVSIREETDSPILGAPFLSQVYVFADYQARTLSVGLANNTMAYTEGPDELQCVQHGLTDGDLGWAVGSLEAYEASKTASSTASPAATGEGKKNGGVRGGVGVGVCVSALVLSIGLLL
ncbi:hypothetical protein BKA65DRAFT_563074 [Rhexocercosporidium sp. MPI-PUGE-AT-0058]|nr:hypothetical protein BKA65DRAFT_563074 [Rhexocercosporidium sp. MPI-PUGE-AT-0058]